MNIMNDKSSWFCQIEHSLIKLAQSDSSIEYAPHIRKEFDEVVNGLNKIKEELELEIIIHESDWYFNNED